MSNRTKKYQATPVSSERLYHVIRSPMITEKATLGSEFGKVTFKVAMDANKPEIKQAVEKLFNVKVKAVNTLVQKGKTKRFRGTKGFRNDTKKAIVTLVDGETIDVSTGI